MNKQDLLNQFGNFLDHFDTDDHKPLFIISADYNTGKILSLIPFVYNDHCLSIETCLDICYELSLTKGAGIKKEFKSKNIFQPKPN